MTTKKTVLLLGATGSIGSQTLNILRQFPENFTLIGIAGGKNRNALEKIKNEFFLKNSQVFLEEDAQKAENSLVEFIKNTPADIYVNAISGMAGIPATLEIMHQKNPLCLANKESLVAKGETIMTQKKCDLIPIDSEHSSMAHLLSKVKKSDVKSIWLTASGGPFRDAQKFPKHIFSELTAKDALKHPTWSMGAKISIDSSTLMNKAFELIEAVRLFDFPVETYKIVVHPQSIIHAAVETKDGNLLLEASTPTMLLPIARALFEAAGEDIPNDFSVPAFNPFLEKNKNLSFEEVDEERFPSLLLAKKALSQGENACQKFLQKNDAAVEKFLKNEISFADIFTEIAFQEKGEF